MLDIKIVREETEKVKTLLARRGKRYDAEVDRALALDEQRRALILESESIKAEQNRMSKQIPALKKEGKDTTELMAQMKALADRAKAMTGELSGIEEELRQVMLGIPCVPDESVPEGRDSEENVAMRTWGTPRDFGFAPKAHWDVGADLDILDMPRATKVTGTRFAFMRAGGAALERAFLNFCLDSNTKAGFTELMCPFMANSATLTGTGQLPKFADQMFKLEGTDYYLISTGEIPATNYFAGEIIDGERLPIYHTTNTACFRSEAGAAGRDTRGLIRMHQFHKVEIVKFVRPEDSMAELETLVAQPESLLQALGLPYRVVVCCTGDMGANQAKQYDIEVWMPSYGKYVEISSCSNYVDYQARRAGIRFKREKGGKTEFVHTLNGSSLPAERAIAAILENYQNEDGTVTVPEALRPYMGGRERITKE
ncbi:MAG: serine--tRNA ligase [Clostridia bacterium]|nr:serine--tRNA ligase [Clostridia bacterium]